MTTTPIPGDTDNELLFKIAQILQDTQVLGEVVSFNGRNGAVTLTAADVTAVLAGATVSGDLTANIVTAHTGGMLLETVDSATVFAYNFAFQKRGTTGDATAAVANASELGNILWRAWNGASYVSAVGIVAKTTEAQSSGHSGGELQFRTSANASGALAVSVFISSNHNILISNVNTIEPASLVGGLVWKDGTAASGDPTTASAMWSVGGSIQYRTSGASEGSGQTNSLHNRAAEQAGVGSNYTLTNSTAQVAFGTTNAAVTLPTAGTYYIQANVSIINGATADDIYDAKLRNTTDGADIGVNKKVSGGPASGRVNILLTGLVTVAAASKVVSIFAFNETAARGTVESTTTDIRYIRLF